METAAVRVAPACLSNRKQSTIYYNIKRRTTGRSYKIKPHAACKWLNEADFVLYNVISSVLVMYYSQAIPARVSDYK